MRTDGGDVCAERDSSFIAARRAQLKAFERANSATRVSKALLRSPLTLTLADLVALVTDTDLMDVLTKLCAVLERQPAGTEPHSAPAHLSALHAVAKQLTDDEDCLATVHAALLTHAAPPVPKRT